MAQIGRWGIVFRRWQVFIFRPCCWYISRNRQWDNCWEIDLGFVHIRQTA